MHARLEEEEVFVSKKTLYRLLRKYREHHIYYDRPTDLQRVDHKTALTVDWSVG